MKQILTGMLALLTVGTAMLSCGDSAGNEGVTTATPGTSADTAVTDAETDAYNYEYSKTFGGEEIIILNAEDIYSMRAQIDRESTTGEPLDDAMYNRCRLVEEKLDIKLVEETGNPDGPLADKARKAITAGDDVYDIMYIPARNLTNFIEGDFLYDLLDIEALQLEQPWWSKSYNDSCILNDSLYAAVGASQLMYIDSLWCLYFNESMMTNLDLQFPYDYVRDGTWTYDRLAEYVKAGVQLNADTSFNWDPSGTCVYGMSGNAGEKFFAAAGEFFIESADGKLTYTAGTDRFYAIADKMGSFMRTDDGTLFAGLSVNDGEPGNYITTFESERSLFLMAEICKTSRMRDKDFNFGIVPIPKYDEAQETYYSVPFYATPGFAIPVTVADTERSAIVGDALAYTGFTYVLPIFRETTLEQKGLQNEDSIEMLKIIIDSSRADLCNIYNIGADTRSIVSNAVFKGEAIASTLAKHEKKIAKLITRLNDKE